MKPPDAHGFYLSKAIGTHSLRSTPSYRLQPNCMIGENPVDSPVNFAKQTILRRGEAASQLLPLAMMSANQCTTQHQVLSADSGVLTL